MDPGLLMWARDGADTFACKHQSGKHYIESTHYTNFSVMDPSTVYWQKKISSVAGSIVSTHNTSGIYLDQLASFYAELCHEPGVAKGGTSWADGSRQIAKQTIEAIGPGKVLISESNAEAYLGDLHAYLAICEEFSITHCTIDTPPCKIYTCLYIYTLCI